MDPKYEPIIFKSNRLLQKFLRGKPIFNGSLRTLSPIEIEALALGRNFVPSHNQPASANLQNETSKLINDIDKVIHFAIPRVNFYGNNRRGYLSKESPSLWQPPPREWVRDPDALTLINKITEGQSTQPRKTLDPRLHDALEKLKNDPHIYISPSDKGGCLVLWRRIEYNREALSQLEDSKTYRRINLAELEEHLLHLKFQRNEIAVHLLKNKWITKNEYTSIRRGPNKASPIYFLPKLHKKINDKSRTFHGRPIVSTIHSTLHLLDKYLANITAPLLSEIPGSLRDTTHLLNLLPNWRIPEPANLITIDVNALYPSIPWREGVEATTEFYSIKIDFLISRARRDGHLDPPDPPTFKKILLTILENSIISYQNEAHFHQIKGTAMGACISVFFANCYMWKLTVNIIVNPPSHILLFLRYIDDIIILTTADLNQIMRLLESISNDHITYSQNKLGKSTEFLDVLITINPETGLIETAPFSKPSASPTYLHADSMHPRHLIKSIPFAQLLRLRRNSSDIKHFSQPASKLITRFLARGYKKAHLLRALAATLNLDRNALLTPRPRTSVFTNAFKFIPIFDFHHDWKKLRVHLNNLLLIVIRFYGGTYVGETLAKRDIKLIFRRARNLASLWSPKIKNGTKQTRGQ